MASKVNRIDQFTSEANQPVLRELAGIVAESPSMIFERSWQSGEWKQANSVPIFKKGRKEYPGNY